MEVDMSESLKKKGVESPELSEEVINAMRAWSGIDPDSEVLEESGVITTIINTSLLGNALVREYLEMFISK